ncbi:MAG TPA: SDR family oxidoreductase [Pseudolabrys sp.]
MPIALKPICLITGASAGIGAELARVFARNGHVLVLTARREAQLNTLAEEIVTAGHVRPYVITADLGAPDGPARLAEALAGAGLEPSYVVNNAGFGIMGDAADIDQSRQLEMIDLNIRALTDLSLRWIESIKRHRGGILNVGSLAGFLPGPGMAVYNATKAFVLSFSEAMHQELAEDGVKVCALCPGPVDTEFFGLAGIPDGEYPRMFRRSAGRVADDGYNALMGGHRVVVPGFPNRVASLMPRLFPRALLSAVAEWRRNPKSSGG